MQSDRIAELLQPFLPVPLVESQLQAISTYIDILLRWNARVNLTSVRQPEEIVTRHFGESLFAARQLFPTPAGCRASLSSSVPHARTDAVRPQKQSKATTNNHVIDVGSGAGFPGIPIKVWAPQVHLTLIESNYKKATFLKEVARALTLTDIDVVSTRAEDFFGQADIVIRRAVERFEAILPIAARLVVSGGVLALLVGERQLQSARQFGNVFRWSEPLQIPLSSKRVLLLGDKEPC